MKKVNEENERIKRCYLRYLRAARRKNSCAIEKAAGGILRFEASTSFGNFKTFRIGPVIKFCAPLDEQIRKAAGKPLSNSTIAGVLAANNGFTF
jgi:hypothetical protein